MDVAALVLGLESEFMLVFLTFKLFDAGAPFPDVVGRLCRLPNDLSEAIERECFFESVFAGFASCS